MSESAQDQLNVTAPVQSYLLDDKILLPQALFDPLTLQDLVDACYDIPQLQLRFQLDLASSMYQSNTAAMQLT